MSSDTKIAQVKLLGIIFLCTAAINSLWIFTQLYAVTSLSTPMTAWLGLSAAWFLFFPMLLFPIALLASGIGMIFKKTRRDAALLGFAAICFVITGVFAMTISGRIRSAAFQHLAERSVPLIDAVSAYELANGSPPETLEHLVPKFLPSVPKTGMGAYPQYEYVRCGVPKTPPGISCYGNAWIIHIPTSPGGVNFDSFVYLPNKQYPEKGYGGSLRRVGDWAYVNE